MKNKTDFWQKNWFSSFYHVNIKHPSRRVRNITQKFFAESCSVPGTWSHFGFVLGFLSTINTGVLKGNQEGLIILFFESTLTLFKK